MSEPASERELLRRDVHPAELKLPDGRLVASVRVFLTTRRLVAYRATAHGGIEPVCELALEQPCSVTPERSTLQGSLEVRLADGQTAWINRGRGCGCGSPLKALAQPVGWA